MTTQHHGMSKRSLLLLGGLTAAVANPAARQKLLDLIGTASEGAQSAYQDTVKPLAVQAGQQVQASVQEVGARAQELAHLAAERGTELAQVAAERGSDLASVAVSRGGDVASTLRDSGSRQAQALLVAAQPVLSQAQQRLGSALEDVQERVQDSAQQVRKEGGKVVTRKVKQGRRQALRLQKELAHEVGVRGANLEKVSAKKLKAAEKDLKKRGRQITRKVRGEPQRRGVSGFVLAPLLLIGFGVVLARFPNVRHAILNFVRGFSPEAADALHAAGTSVRDIVGNVWLESIEPEMATPAPSPKPSQATGSAYGASVEPGSPAQATPPQPAATETKPAEGGSVKN